MKILVIEDDIDLTRILKKSLESESFTVDIAYDGKRGSFIARTNEYDVIILDNILPKKSGIEVCKDIRNTGKTTPIIMLSSLSEIPEKVQLLKAGVDDYITKPYSFEELIARIRTVLRRGREYKPGLYSYRKILLDSNSQEVTKNGEYVYLTRKEYALLELLIKNTGKIVSRGLIMEHAWNMDADPFSRTIDTHIVNLRKKLNDKESIFIQSVPGRGYRIV